MIFTIVGGRAVGGAIVGGVLLVGVIVNVGSGASTVATLTFPSSDAFPVDMFHLRRGLVGGALARASFSVEQDGTCYAASFSHGGSRANPVTFDSDFAGCEHAFAALASGDQTCDAVATAAASALTTAGASDVAADGCDVTVDGATAVTIGRARSTDRNDQGVFGMQRDLAFASGATTNGAMGATGGVHLDPRCDGRIIAACIRADGGENVRLGIGEGPDYAADPTAITILAEGVASAVDNNAIGCIVPADPVAVTTTDDTWLVFRGSATEQLRFREHAATPVGNGDLVSGESLVWSALSGDSAVELGASVDLGGGGGPFALYAHVFYVDECEDAGTYPGDGAIDEWVGLQSTSIVGADVTDPTDMVDETVTFRYPALPWSSVTMTAIRQGVGTHTAGDDFGLAVYSWAVADVPEFPSLSAADLLVNLGAFGVSAASGFNTHTLASALDVSDATLGGDSIGVLWNCGRTGGAAATSLQFVYDEDGFAGTNCDLAHWTDDGRAWSDFCDEQGYDIETEYQTRESNGSTMSHGDPTVAQPDPFAIDSTGTTDAAPLNVPRQAIRIVRPGITGSVN